MPAQNSRGGWGALYDVQERKRLEREKTAQEADPPQPTPSIPNHPPPTTFNTSPAPTRDYNRRANSLERDALPSGLFPGSSKKLYDALYLRTLGAIQPRASIRATKRDLMDWSGIRNVKTIEVHVRHLLTVGLMVRSGDNGDREGFTYEIRLPEDISYQSQPTPTNPNQPQSEGTHPNQKTGMGGDQKTGMVGVGQTIANKGTYESPNTNIIQEEIDDEAFAKALLEAARELTGKEPTVREWNALFELLATELKIAAARTTVSNVPAFLAEHLRRRLWKIDKKKEPVSSDKGESANTHSALTAEQTKACPDCGGTGFYYPTGYEGGVAKCRHQTLLSSTDTQPLEQG